MAGPGRDGALLSKPPQRTVDIWNIKAPNSTSVRCLKVTRLETGLVLGLRGVEIVTLQRMRKYTISFSIAVLIFWCYFVSHEKDTLFLGTENNWKEHLLNISLLLAIENSFPETCHSVLRGTILK